ncbi:MAG: hypothetical protein IJU94_05245 [Clostridia bacterium]|nr:hypothetical protein [Clostridia bacterium]
MTQKKSVKRALISSVLILTMCFTMLVGSTFAWFTDSVTSAGNRIVSGSLKVDLLMYKGDAGYVSIAGGAGDIFKEADVAQDSSETLWEPGKTQIVYLGVKNLGSLALKYNIWLRSVSPDATAKLTEAFDYAIIDGLDYETAQAQLGNVSTWSAVKAIQGVQTGSVPEGDYKVADNGILDEITAGVENETDYFVLALHMKEEAGNEYQGKQFVFDVCVVAGQATAEEDSFDNLYDAESEYGDYVVYSSAQLAGVIAHVNSSPSENRVNIAMGDDFTYANEPLEITNGKIVKLDLAGHNLTMNNTNSNGINVSAGATLTLTNSKDTGSYTFNSTKNNIFSVNVSSDVEGETATLNIKDVTINVDATRFVPIRAVAEAGEAVINIEDGAVINITGASNRRSAGVEAYSGSTVNMNGGTINVSVTGGYSGIDAVGILVWNTVPGKQAVLNINGGTINVTGGGTFAHCVQTGNSGSTGNVVNMTGGAINVTGQNASAFVIAGNADITVSGGSISVGVDTGYEGCGFNFELSDSAYGIAVQLKDGIVTLNGDNNVLTNAPGRVTVVSE